MTRPTPAIVSERAARPIPRPWLWGLCVTYVLAGFVGRDPWKSADMAAFGYMAELVAGTSDWWVPTLLGQAPERMSLLPYWLGALSIQALGGWLGPGLAARLPFIGLLALALAATWWGTYCLARLRAAQPVAFAFGGEAEPAAYATVLADGALLALLASLGLAQLGHEATPTLARLGFGALLYAGLASLPLRPWRGLAAAVLGLAGLALSGAEWRAVVLLLPLAALVPAAGRVKLALAAAVLGLAGVSWALGVGSVGGVFAWGRGMDFDAWRREARLLLWFTWPAWPLALITVARWRRQWRAWHVLLPLYWTVLVTSLALLSATSDRILLLALPALATLAAFALPTLERGVSAFIDWFTLLFFTGWGIVIWVVWIAMQTGFPPQPAANVARLAPGFVPSWSVPAFVVAVAATGAWLALARWRTGRHREALWKSLVLPAAGATLCWTLFMSLWLPLLDFARSYGPLVRQVVKIIEVPGGCTAVDGMSRAQIAALRYYGGLDLRAGTGAACPWLLVDASTLQGHPLAAPGHGWARVATVRRPSDNDEDLVVFRRDATAAVAPVAVEPGIQVEPTQKGRAAP